MGRAEGQVGVTTDDAYGAGGPSGRAWLPDGPRAHNLPRQFGFVDTGSAVRGAHQLKTGIDYQCFETTDGTGTSDCCRFRGERHSDCDRVYHASVAESAHGGSRSVFHVLFNRSRVNGEDESGTQQVGRRGSDLQGRRAVP
jgi:hypothetical protein